ncbi:hypothetical protein CK203_064411 [Vitis vinifera]|uniref:Uncharacterized protein n=1 Tax=Vitis vinifera TaxID=29760 RepID=A0A438G4B9_VITVI|nr:hypothetical protein CK203_064411 [Vitis vinifera]
MEEAKKEQLQFEVSADFAVNPPSSSKLHKDEEDGSFITIVVAKNKEKDLTHHSSSSQILPLVSSPSTFDHQLARNPSCTTASQIKYFLSFIL